jgi:hypothetical protein
VFTELLYYVLRKFNEEWVCLYLPFWICVCVHMGVCVTGIEKKCVKCRRNPNEYLNIDLI